MEFIVKIEEEAKHLFHFFQLMKLTQMLNILVERLNPKFHQNPLNVSQKNVPKNRKICVRFGYFHGPLAMAKTWLRHRT